MENDQVETMMDTSMSQDASSSPPPADKDKAVSAKCSQEEMVTCSSSQSSVTTAPAATGHGILIKMLDEMDERVEKLRATAILLEGEKDNILSSLDAFTNADMVSQLEGIELDEVTRYIDRLIRRCIAVDVDIKTERSPPQMESLHKVNNLIDNLIRDMKEDAGATRKRCISYINACSEQITIFDVGIDATFENAVLGCAVEDQKRVRKRLSGLYSYFTKTFTVLEEEEEEETIRVGEAIKRSLQS